MSEEIRLVSFVKRHTRGLLIVGAVLSLLVATFEFTGRGFLGGDKAGIYWLEVDKISLFTLPIMYYPITLMVLAIVLFLFARKKQLGFGILIVTFTVVAAVIVATLAGPDIGFGSFKHVDTLRANNRIYYLGADFDLSTMCGEACLNPYNQGAACNPLDYCAHEFIVFRCDAFGLFCRRINAERRDHDTGSIRHASLGVKNNSIVLVVDGRQVWAAPVR